MTDKQDQEAALARQVSAALPMAQDLRRAGWSLARIADHLDSEGVPTPSRWKGKPTRWNGKSVKRLLDQAVNGEPTAPRTPDPPQESEQPSSPINVTGPITVTAPGVAITLTGLSGPVKVAGPFTVAEDDPTATPARHQKKSPIIQLSQVTAWELSQAIGGPVGHRVFPDPLFLRRR